MASKPWTHINPTGPALCPERAAQYLKRSRRSYDRGAAAGVLPRPQPLGIKGNAKFIPKRWLTAVIEDSVAQGAGK